MDSEGGSLGGSICVCMCTCVCMCMCGCVCTPPPYQALSVLEDTPLVITGVAFNDVDFPGVYQRYNVDITAQYGSVEIQRYDRLQVFNITRDGFVNGTEEKFDDILHAADVCLPSAPFCCVCVCVSVWASACAYVCVAVCLRLCFSLVRLLLRTY